MNAPDLAILIPPRDREAALNLLDDQQLAKFTLMAEEVKSISDSAFVRPLQSDGEEAGAAILLNRGVIALKELDSLRRARVDPLMDEVRSVNALVAVLTDPIKALVGDPKGETQAAKNGRLGTVLLAWRAEKRNRVAREKEESDRKAREAAEREAAARAKADAAKTDKARQKHLDEAEAASKAQTEAVLAAPLPMTRGVKTEVGAVSERGRFVLAGFSDMDLVPPSYWRDPVVLEALKRVLQRAITAGLKEIPGCVVEWEEGLLRRPGA